MKPDSLANAFQAVMPTVQMRVTMLFMALFVLAILGVLLYARLGEVREKRSVPSGVPTGDDGNERK